MYEITVESEFAAAHAIVIAGARETLHGHNWHVVVKVSGDRLDADGLLCDFHTVEDLLREIVTPFHNRNLNDVAPFDRINPTAELVAKHIGDELAAGLNTSLAPAAWVSSVCVTEAARCTATYRLGRPA
jgi:6-pyruvoyltetrahydropterin/6-carboxytetrahydropterin synthase